MLKKLVETEQFLKKAERENEELKATIAKLKNEADENHLKSEVENMKKDIEQLKGSNGNFYDSLHLSFVFVLFC